MLRRASTSAFPSGSSSAHRKFSAMSMLRRASASASPRGSSRSAVRLRISSISRSRSGVGAALEREGEGERERKRKGWHGCGGRSVQNASACLSGSSRSMSTSGERRAVVPTKSEGLLSNLAGWLSRCSRGTARSVGDARSAQPIPQQLEERKEKRGTGGAKGPFPPPLCLSPSLSVSLSVPSSLSDLPITFISLSLSFCSFSSLSHRLLPHDPSSVPPSVSANVPFSFFSLFFSFFSILSVFFSICSSPRTLPSDPSKIFACAFFSYLLFSLSPREDI
eukprot:scaffold17768_cov31-Tisochrysis_lutea.AAC.1